MKETMEVLDMLKVLAVCYAESKRDGSVNILDLPKFIPVISELFKALEGADRISDELKSLDISKVLMLADKFREIAVVARG